MIKVEADNIAAPGEPKKAILMTGAHHSRELVSVQQPLFMLLDLLHGFVQNDPEKMLLLARNKYYIIPMVNVDGSFTIYDQYEKTGELVYKRKNNDRRFEGESDCELRL